MMLSGFLLLLLLRGGSPLYSPSVHDDLEGGSTSHSSGSMEEESFYRVPDYDIWFEDDYSFMSRITGHTDQRFDLDIPSGTGPLQDAPPIQHRDADVINLLNLTDKVKFAMTRPVKNHARTTRVIVTPEIHAVLDVKEKEQKFITLMWIRYVWENELISWKPENFSNMSVITLPVDLLWKPDITILETTERNNAFTNPYLNANYRGFVSIRMGMVLVSTCRMKFFKFPLDTHNCTFTFMSVGHFATAIELQKGSNLSVEDIREHMQTEAEWQLTNIIVENKIMDNFGNRSMLVYTLSIKRCSVLYVVNFILPILFFLCLDLASFLIIERGGEKLSFKVTVLLAVTVMQLILNDILPSSSDRIPLIAIYCIGVFGLMFMSLLETILVMYLMERDSLSQDREAGNKQSLTNDCRDKQGRFLNCLKGMNQLLHCSCILDVPPAKIPPTLLQEGGSSQLTGGVPGEDSRPA